MQFNGSLMVALYRDKSMDAFSRGRTVDESMCNDQRLKSKHMFLYVDWMYIYIMYVRRTTCMIWFSITEDCYLRWWFSIVQKIWLCCSKKACCLLIVGHKMHVQCVAKRKYLVQFDLYLVPISFLKRKRTKSSRFAQNQ